MPIAKKGTFNSVEAKYVRIFWITKTLEAYRFSIYNFELYGTKKASLKLRKKSFLQHKDLPSKIFHKVKCRECGGFPIFGIRFKCAICENFDYCEECENKLSEKHNHPFLKIYEPKMAPVYFKCFSASLN